MFNVVKACLIFPIVQELCESRSGRPGLSALTSLLFSVDVKNYWTVTLWDTGFKCKSCTQFMCLIINHFVTVTIMYYSNLQVNYMVTIFIRYLLLFRLLRLLSCSKCFVCLCLFQHRYCFLVGWCTNKSYVIATSDLCFFIHASNLLPLLPTPLPYSKTNEQT